jgi:hypothetical protein
MIAVLPDIAGSAAERSGDVLRRHASLCSEIAELIDDPDLAREFHDIALEIEFWAVEIEAPPVGRFAAHD